MRDFYEMISDISYKLGVIKGKSAKIQSNINSALDLVSQLKGDNKDLKLYLQSSLFDAREISDLIDNERTK